MASTRSKWIDTAWRLIVDGHYDEARRILRAIVEEKDSGTVAARSLNTRWSEIGDAEECLAAISYLTGDFRGTVSHAQQAVMRSGRFRPGMHLLAANALANLGETELAISKLCTLIRMATDLGLASVALAQLRDLTHNKPGSR